MKRFVPFVLCLLSLVVTSSSTTSAAPLAPQSVNGSAFSYQGRLSENGAPANGSYDLQFLLYDAPEGGTQRGPSLTFDNVAVRDGLFTVALDFGAVFDGTALFLAISVRRGASMGELTPLLPRQALTPAPYATTAHNLALPFKTSASSGDDLVSLTNNGTGGGLQVVAGAVSEHSALTGYASSTGRYAAEFEVINTSSSWAALYARTSGSGQAIDAEINANTTADALFARTTSTLAGSYAGMFSGPVQVNCQPGNCNTANALQVLGDMNVTGTLSKSAGSFKIDHPLDPANKYLSHSFVESPDMKNIYDGVVTTDEHSLATVELPDYFEALNRDFRYQLTVIGTFAQAIVKDEIANNRFVIQTDRPNVKVSWQVTGIRQDAYANAHRIPVEQDKPQGERGHYLAPELWGQPARLSSEPAQQEPAIQPQPAIQEAK